MDRVQDIFYESNTSQLKKFIKLFGYEQFPELHDIMLKRCELCSKKINIGELGRNPLFPSQSLWERAKFGIATCSNHAESMHSKLNQKIRNLRNKSYYDRFEIVFESIIERFETATKRRNLSEAIKRVKYSVKDYQSTIIEHVKPSKFHEFYSSLYHIDFPDITNIWQFKIIPFEDFDEHCHSDIAIESDEKIIAEWCFKEKSQFSIPELDDISNLLIKVYGIPKKTNFDSILNLMKCDDNEKKKN